MDSAERLTPAFSAGSDSLPLGSASQPGRSADYADLAGSHEKAGPIHVCDIQAEPNAPPVEDNPQESQPDMRDRERSPESSSFLYRCAVTMMTCAGCLLTGFSICWMLPTPPPQIIVETVEVPSPPPKFVACAIRRNEPIAPLLPSLDLDDSLVELGHKLFLDPGLSRSGMVSCATCHQLESGGDDGLPAAKAFDAELTFNTPSIWNAGLNATHSWDARSATLEEHLDDAQGNPHQLGNDWSEVIDYLELHDEYRADFRQLFGGAPTADRVKTALATYVRSLISQGSPFDRWLAGDEEALGADEFGGYYLFKKMGCINCHQGPNVGGSLACEMDKLQDYFAAAGPGDERDLGRFNTTGTEADRYVFRVPSLRNVEHTGPYFHDGSVATLDEAVTVMVERQLGQPANAEDIRRLVAFLKSLSGQFAD